MRIYLTESFSGEPVRVTVEGKTVLELGEAKTDWSVGLAGSTEVELKAGDTVEVAVSGGQLTASRRVQWPENRALVVALGPEGLQIEERPEPVRFM